ncbi:MAG: hypothetical protein PHH14_05425 [Candidatus Margulisbacteria bacterium]|nr:hypothetical protein [Candidatus Margulisiibacteriota bacterium]
MTSVELNCDLVRKPVKPSSGKTPLKDQRLAGSASFKDSVLLGKSGAADQTLGAELAIGQAELGKQIAAVLAEADGADVKDGELVETNGTGFSLSASSFLTPLFDTLELGRELIRKMFGLSETEDETSEKTEEKKRDEKEFEKKLADAKALKQKIGALLASLMIEMKAPTKATQTTADLSQLRSLLKHLGEAINGLGLSAPNTEAQDEVTSLAEDSDQIGKIVDRLHQNPQNNIVV